MPADCNCGLIEPPPPPWRPRAHWDTFPETTCRTYRFWRTDFRSWEWVSCCGSQHSETWKTSSSADCAAMCHMSCCIVSCTVVYAVYCCVVSHTVVLYRVLLCCILSYCTGSCTVVLYHVLFNVSCTVVLHNVLLHCNMYCCIAAFLFVGACHLPMLQRACSCRVCCRHGWSAFLAWYIEATVERREGLGGRRVRVQGGRSPADRLSSRGGGRARRLHHPLLPQRQGTPPPCPALLPSRLCACVLMGQAPTRTLAC